MEESILKSIKKMLGIPEDQERFDSDIIMHINSVLMILTQIGVGPPEGMTIHDDTVTWDEFVSEESNLEAVKSYIGMKVKLLFDPPMSSAVMEATNRMISELEWRLNIGADSSN